MSDKRYQVYISTASPDDVRNENLKLEYALLNLGVIPWQFHEPRTLLTNALARRQIDDCDWVIFLLGKQYGDLSPSGVSYMQLDYMYAVNKQKPIMVFMNAQPEPLKAQMQANNPELNQKFTAFRQLLSQDNRYLYEFHSANEIERQLKVLYQTMTKDFPELGWTRSSGNDGSNREILQLRQKIAHLEQQALQAKISVPAQTPTQQPLTTADNSDDIVVQYRTQAYQDGNLKDLHLQHQLSLTQILNVLAPHFIQPTNESYFQSILNQYLERQALQQAQTILPCAHAVARTRIDARSLQQIKLQMKWNNWIVPQHDTNSASRVQWYLTSEGKRLAKVA